jgi:hypothetical protein
LKNTLGSSETSVTNHRQTQHNTQHDLNLQHRCEKFKYRRCDTYASATRFPTPSFPDEISLYSMVCSPQDILQRHFPMSFCLH